jgi:hypothetical protein
MHVDSKNRQRNFSQRIAYALAMLSFAAAVGCVAGLFLYEPTAQLDPVRASLMASTVFFVGVGVVLYVIGTARLKGLLSLKQ